MPRYLASKSWPKTAKRVLRIVATRHIFVSTVAAEVGVKYPRLYANLHNGNQPDPLTEKRILKWCDKHDPKTK